jgi:HTH-type transcriptional regulator/antitoxin HigA
MPVDRVLLILLSATHEGMDFVQLEFRAWEITKGLILIGRARLARLTNELHDGVDADGRNARSHSHTAAFANDLDDERPLCLTQPIHALRLNYPWLVSSIIVQFAKMRRFLLTSTMSLVNISEMGEYSTPGQLIQALLDRNGWSQRILAVVLNVGETTVNKVIAGTQPVEANMALALSELFGVPAEDFMGLQASYDLAQARIVSRPDPGRTNRAYLFGKLPVAEMMRRGWIPSSDVRDAWAVESSLATFFGVESVEDIEILPHAAKKTKVAGDVSPMEMAWLYRVRRIANDLLVPRYSSTAARNAVSKLSELLLSPQEARNVPKILAECGIRYVVVEKLTGATIDGVCFWLDDDSPVIGMSCRFDRIDNFWFVLRHELEHVLRLHGRSLIFIDSELEGEKAGTGQGIPEEERLANEAAAEFCVPQKSLDALIARKAPFFADRDILGFARSLHIHPGLVAGQLRHRLNRYNRFAKHLVKIRSIIAPNAAVDGWGDVYPFEDSD